ncbi:site-specific integrase [bacterium]|nr:site-specific integrase [bacterium]
MLEVHRVLDFLEWLVANKKWNYLAAGVALQGLAGLQLQEALRLRWGNVDFDNCTITIEGEVKNRYRIRRIPVCSVVLWLLKWHRRSFEVRTPNNNRVLRHYQRYEGYSDAVRKALALWDPKVVLKPKDLRNTLQTAAIDGGWYDYYLKRYVGHAPTTIGEKHYFGDQGRRLTPLFQEKVVKNIEVEISTWEAPEPSLILPGPRLVKRQEA